MITSKIENKTFEPTRLAGLFAAGVIALALTGCGSNDDAADTQAANESPSTSDNASTDSAEPGSAMAKGEQIRERISGNTVSGTMDPESTYTEYYAPDGTIHGASYQAKWNIDGDRMCFNYDEAPQADCYAVKIDGNAVEWHLDGETQGKGTIVEGNPNNF